MATQKQIEANRMNSRRSTGPRTDGGKLRSSLNAVKHGAYARELLTPDEQDGELIRLQRIHVAHYRPKSALELEEVLKLAACELRQRRYARMEAEILAAHGFERDPEKYQEFYYAGAGWGLSHDCSKSNSVSVLSQVEARLTREIRALKKELAKRLPAPVKAAAQSKPKNSACKPDEKPAGEANEAMTMKPISSPSLAEAGSMPNQGAADARWHPLLRNSHYAAPTDLPPGPRTRKWLAGKIDEEERIRQKWAGTTPQVREIIRKKLHAFKKRFAAEQEAAGQAKSKCGTMEPGADVDQTIDGPAQSPE